MQRPSLREIPLVASTREIAQGRTWSSRASRKRLTEMTITSGAIAVNGVSGEMIGMDWRIAMARK